MKTLLTAATFTALVLSVAPAVAALKVGSHAPQFTAAGFLDGKPLTFDLKEALKKGPVVLYFFPGPHTPGCNTEAHLFAESIDKFHALGASVIGVTSSNLNQLATFSRETEFCSGKFPVAADPTAGIAKQYDATADIPMPIPLSSRVSYVITPKGQIISVWNNMAPRGHLDQSLAALRMWRSKHPV
jgi:peroxiredoxin Q/BCP